jgi:hypothetical protein
MKNLTTPQAVLGGLALIALAIASIPYSSNIVTPAHANNNTVHKIAICNVEGSNCADIHVSPLGNRKRLYIRN